VLLRWAQGQGRRELAQARFEAWRKGEGPRVAVEKAIADGRAFARELLEYAKRTENEFPGTAEAAWLESWYVSWLLLEPLRELETRIKADHKRMSD
jgi:hypothetical protein